MKQNITIYHLLTNEGKHEFPVFESNQKLSGYFRRKENKKKYISKSKVCTISINTKVNKNYL